MPRGQIVMNNFLQDFLLLRSTNIEEVLRIVRSISTPLLSLTFLLGAVFEKFGDQNFLGLFKRLVIALFLISFGPSFLKSSVQLSFDISSKILSSTKKTNPVVQLIDRARTISKGNGTQKMDDGTLEKSKNASSGLWESAAFVSKLLIEDGMSTVVFVISYCSLLILGQFYTIVYNFTFVSMPLIATLIVFPPTYSVSNSITRTISWVFLMPIFTMITILLLSMSFPFPQDGSEVFYFTSFENLINFCIMSMMLLFIPIIVSGFLSGAGILSAAETFSKTTAMAVASGGSGFIVDKAKSIGTKLISGRDYGAMTLTKLGINRGLNRLGAQSIEASKRLNTKTSDQQGNPLNYSSHNREGSKNHVKDAFSGEVSEKIYNQSGPSTSMSSFSGRLVDRAVVASDSILNYRKNHIAKKALRTDLREAQLKPSRETQAQMFNNYKQKAHKDALIRRPIDDEVSRLRGVKTRGSFGSRNFQSTKKSDGSRREFIKRSQR